jgi:hypothetical protein
MVSKDQSRIRINRHRNHQSRRLAAFNIGGFTLHNALGIGTEEGEKSVKMSHKRLSQLAAPRYIIVDEISIM